MDARPVWRGHRYRRNREMRVRAVAALVLLAVFAASVPRAAATVAVLCDGLPPTQPPLTSAGTLVGTAADDVLIGSSGNDVIKGLDGNDRICGGLGSDKIYGGDGNDRIIGEENTNNSCTVGYGDDLLKG